MRNSILLWLSRKSGRRSQSRRSQPAHVEFLEQRELLAADFQLLLDINPGVSGSVNLNNVNKIAVGEWLFFNADDGVHGSELWKTDGTTVNTQMMIDLLPGAGSSSPSSFFEADGSLYFNAFIEYGTAPNVVLRSSTMVTDGTAAGTHVFLEGPVAGTVSGFRPRAKAGNSLLLTGGNTGSGASKPKLYLSDGTNAGTVVIVEDIEGTTEGVRFDGTTFIGVDTGPEGSPRTYRLWTSDGTVAGTTSWNDQYVLTTEPFIYNGSMFFGARFNGSSEAALWRLDTASGTPQQIGAANHLTGPLNPTEFGVVNGKLYFQAQPGEGLWKSEGSTSTTYVVTGNTIPSLRPEMIVDGAGTAFFFGRVGTNQTTLWRSDGEKSTTRQVIPFLEDSPDEIVSLNGQVYFTRAVQSDLPPLRDQLWVSNGYAGPGTKLVSGFIDTFRTREHQQLTVLGDKLLLLALDDAAGAEWFVFTPGGMLGTPTIISPPPTTDDATPAFSWSAVTDAEQYEVWLSHKPSGTDRLFVEAVIGTTFTPSQPLPIGLNSFWVRALGIDGASNGNWTSQYNFRVKTPVSMQATDVDQSTSRPTVHWDSLTGADHYDVWIDRLDVPTSQYIRDTSVTQTSFTPPNDMPIGRYRIWVRGVDAGGGFANWSEQQTFNVVPPPIPNQTQSTFGSTPAITWSPVTGAQSYEVYLTNSTGGILIANPTGLTGTSWTPPNLPPNEYKFSLLAVNSVGTRTLWSSPMPFSTRGKTLMLSPTGTMSGNPWPVFSWLGVQGAVRYELYANRVNEAEGVLNVTDITGTSFTEPSPATFPKGNYRVWVRAVNGDGTLAPWSDPLSFSVV